MASSTENEGPSYSPRISKTAIDEEEEEEEELLPPPDQVSMQKFRLYKTQSVVAFFFSLSCLIWFPFLDFGSVASRLH
jgi:hypothetical protein